MPTKQANNETAPQTPMKYVEAQPTIKKTVNHTITSLVVNE